MQGNNLCSVFATERSDSLSHVSKPQYRGNLVLKFSLSVCMSVCLFVPQKKMPRFWISIPKQKHYYEYQNNFSQDSKSIQKTECCYKYQYHFFFQRLKICSTTSIVQYLQSVVLGLYHFHFFCIVYNDHQDQIQCQNS